MTLKLILLSIFLLSQGINPLVLNQEDEHIPAEVPKKEVPKKEALKDFSYMPLEEVEIYAEEGIPEAQYNLGVRYRNINNEMAIKYLKKACEQNYLPAFNFLAITLKSSNPEEAISYYKKGLELGDTQYCGSNLVSDLISLKRYDEALKYASLLAEELPSVKNQLANMYERGLGVGKDLEKAFTLYREAYESNGDGYKYYRGLFYCYANGIGTEQNYPKALQIIEKYCDEYKSTELLPIVAIFYISGLGTDVDLDKAQELLDNTQKNGWDNSKSLFLKTFLFAYKDINNVNYEELYNTRFNHDLKVSGGHFNTNFSRPYYIIQGDNIISNWKIIIDNMLKAANEGDSYAQLCYAYIREKGTYFEIRDDKTIAKKYLRKSAKNNNPIAKKKLKEL